MPDPQQVVDALRTAYATWGYPVVLLGALLENTVLLGLVLPGGSLVLLGAVYAQRGTLALPLVFALGWLGMLLGTSLDYALGRWGLRPVSRRSPRLAEWLEPKLAEARRFLARHGAWALVLAHFIGHVRSFVALTAGASRLPYRRFLVYEGIAALAWNVVWVTAGYLVGENLDRLQHLLGGAGLGLAGLALVGYGVYRLLARRRPPRRPES